MIKKLTRTKLLFLASFGVAAALITLAYTDTPKLIEPTFIPEMVASNVIAANGHPLRVQKFEITVAEWNLCFADGACELRLKSRIEGKEAIYPATGVGWLDVQKYVIWANKNSNDTFRLPTTLEWQELAEEVLPKRRESIFTEPELAWAKDYGTAPKTTRALKPIGSFKTTSTGISDLNGSVWEWTNDCYKLNYSAEECPAFKTAGEHISVIPIYTRDPARGGCAVGTPPAHLGFRLVSDQLS